MSGAVPFRTAPSARHRSDAPAAAPGRPRIEVDILKTLESGERRFELRARFESHAARTAIFGASGAGKTAMLRAVAGLLTPEAGHVRIDGRVLFDRSRGIALPARHRRLGYLFQDYALFPHLNVRQNVGFGLSTGLANPGRRASMAAVDRWLRAFGLEAMAHELPSHLSGGQRQRTALARALVGEPAALLLDEPFAALDPPLRERMRAELDALLAEVGVPVLMITHDPADLERFGERVLRMEDGRVVDDAPQAPP